jgi:hypothetical protein
MHQDYVSSAPKGFKIFASTDICENHRMISEDGRIVTIQGHPEFSLDFMAGVIKYVVSAKHLVLDAGKCLTMRSPMTRPQGEIDHLMAYTSYRRCWRVGN